jgi:hypothetical protein
MKKRKLTLIGALIICAVVIAVKELLHLPEPKDAKLTSTIG